MDNPVLIQKQIKNNTEDLHNYIRDIKLWEKEMKRKDKSMTNSGTVENDVLPPVRRKIKKTETVPAMKVSAKSTKRILGYDYSSWDKFDVDKACEELDNESEDSSEENSVDEAVVKREQALYEKTLGNRYVQDGKWDEAVGAYSRAITADASDAIFYANRALCYLKKNKWKDVEADCTMAIKLDKTYVKAYQRRAEGRKHLGKFEDARKDLLMIIQLEPKNTLARQDLKKIEAILKPTVKNNIISPQAQSISVSNAKKEDSISKVEVLEPSSEESEPLWSSDVCSVKPIIKPPHLRSKKPLKRIPITEVNSIQYSKCSKASGDQVHQTLEKPSEEQKVTNPIIIKEAGDNNGASLEIDEELPPTPKTSVQFEIYWKKIQNNKNQCYQFLKQLRGEDLPEIFKESLESNTFSSIISVLASEFVAAKEPVLGYIEGFSRVRRFSALTLFMSSGDKSNLIKLFSHCRSLGECPDENILRLKKFYEI